MYENPMVSANLAKLKKHGYHVLDPASGELACGKVGPGRMPEPEVIFAEIKKLLK
jgi:phosphopantothenoylcysteine decarboxylase/phosphopantothenate--cysteine ligase